MLLFFHLPTLTKAVLISLIALLTLIGIMVRPFKLNEAMIAMSGAEKLQREGRPEREIVQCATDWAADPRPSSAHAPPKIQVLH